MILNKIPIKLMGQPKFVIKFRGQCKNCIQAVETKVTQLLLRVYLKYVYLFICFTNNSLKIVTFIIISFVYSNNIFINEPMYKSKHRSPDN